MRSASNHVSGCVPRNNHSGLRELTTPVFPDQARVTLALKCKERKLFGRDRFLSPGLPLLPGRHGGYRSIDLVEMELFGPIPVGFRDFSVPRFGRAGENWHPDPC